MRVNKSNITLNQINLELYFRFFQVLLQNHFSNRLLNPIIEEVSHLFRKGLVKDIRTYFYFVFALLNELHCRIVVSVVWKETMKG